MKGREMKPVRNHKDRVFRVLFRDKEEVLGLYNAVNGTNYSNTQDMTLTTLEHAIYVGMKNDVSFVLYDEMMLYEHQSTDNPNIPLRDLLYVANLYSALVPEEKLYSSRAQKIPEPKFIVFYNGQKKVPERFEYKLSDLYHSSSRDENWIPELELKVLVLNINDGYNETIKEKCKTLKGYMIFVEKVRKYNGELSVKEAIERSVDECIQEGVLVDFFRKNRAEVLSVGIFEFDEEKYRAVIREDAREEGLAEGREKGRLEGREEGRVEGREEGRLEGRVEGREEGREEGRLEGRVEGRRWGIDLGIRILIETCQEIGLSREKTLERIAAKFSVGKEEAQRYIEKYWKED